MLSVAWTTVNSAEKKGAGVEGLEHVCEITSLTSGENPLYKLSR